MLIWGRSLNNTSHISADPMYPQRLHNHIWHIFLLTHSLLNYSLKTATQQPTVGDTTCQHRRKSYDRTVRTLCYTAVLPCLLAHHQPIILPLQKHYGIFQQDDVNFYLLSTGQTPSQHPIIQQSTFGEVKVLQNMQIPLNAFCIQYTAYSWQGLLIFSL